MKVKKICKILGVTAAGLTLFITLENVNSMSAYAAEDNSVFISEDTESAAAESVNKNEDYSIKINSSTEKQGFKFTIKDITASKHELRVTALIQSPDSVKDDDIRKNIIQMTVKNSDYNLCSDFSRKIDDNTIEYTFVIRNSNGFNNTVDLRFDAILPQYDVNAWVNTSVDISKYFDKVLEKEVKFTLGNKEFYKIESDILGTRLYFKEDNKFDYSEDSYNEDTWDSQSKLLIKYGDKICEFNERDFDANSDENYTTGYYATGNVNIGSLNNSSEASIIPIKCNIKNKEIEKIFENMESYKTEYSESDNVKYEKEDENIKGKITKVTREEDKIKVYCSADNDEDALFSAVNILGYYDYNVIDDDILLSEQDINNIKTNIYKDSDTQYGYVVEFTNVIKDKAFFVEYNGIAILNSDKFEFEEEVKIK